MTTVADHMTAPVLTLPADAPVGEAADGMRAAGVKSLVVIDDDCRPEGIFTSTDAVAALSDGADPEAATLGDYMTADVATAEPDAPLAAVAERMVDGEFAHLPVTGDGGRVQGILTTTDLAAYLAAADAGAAPDADGVG